MHFAARKTDRAIHDARRGYPVPDHCRGRDLAQGYRRLFHADWLPDGAEYQDLSGLPTKTSTQRVRLKILIVFGVFGDVRFHYTTDANYCSVPLP